MQFWLFSKSIEYTMIKLTFTQEQINQLHFERFNHPKARVRLKMEALFLKSQGFAHHEIQKLCQISSVTLSTYIKQYAQGGIEQLKLNLYKGKPNALQKHAQDLRKFFDKNPPSSSKEAAQIIEEQTGLKRGLTQVRAFMKSIGLHYRKVGAIPAKVLTEDLARKQDEFKQAYIQPKLAEGKMGEQEVFFLDAAHFVHGAFLGHRCSAQRLFVPTASGRSRFNVLGALNAITKETVSVENTSYINSECVCQLLLKLKQRSIGVPITLFLDNARYQTCNCVQDFAKDLGIELIFLPPYSPNLNLIERLWRFVKKKYLNSIYYSNFTEFCQAIRDALKPNEQNLQELETLLNLNFQSFYKAKFSTV